MLLHLGEFKHYSYYLKYVIQFAANCRHLLAPYFTGSNYCWELFTHSLCRSQGGTCVNVKLSQALTPLNCLKTFTPTEKSRLQIKLAITTIFLMHAGIWHRLREAVRHKWHQAADDLARGSPTHCSEHSLAQSTWHCWTFPTGNTWSLEFYHLGTKAPGFSLPSFYSFPREAVGSHITVISSVLSRAVL